MNFGEAIKCMKKGKKVTRNVWKENLFNGRKQFIFIGRNKGLTTNTFLAILPEEELHYELHKKRKLSAKLDTNTRRYACRGLGNVSGRGNGSR